jgi:hypothetical protein
VATRESLNDRPIAGTLLGRDRALGVAEYPRGLATTNATSPGKRVFARPRHRLGRLHVLGSAATLALVLGFPLEASAQTFHGVAGGVGLTGPNPASPGVLLQASLGRTNSGSFAWRLDAFVGHFDITQPSGQLVGVFCVMNPPPGTCCGICPAGTTTVPVGVAGVAASELMSLHTSTSGLAIYFILGIESDWFLQGPSAGAVSFGVSPGLGFTPPQKGRRQVSIEARYHRLIDTPSTLTWLGLVTAGVRF